MTDIQQVLKGVYSLAHQTHLTPIGHVGQQQNFTRRQPSNGRFVVCWCSLWRCLSSFKATPHHDGADASAATRAKVVLLLSGNVQHDQNIPRDEGQGVLVQQL